MSHKGINAERRRFRKERLARRHGQRCAYCLHPFADLSEATLDHIVPYCLWRTWTFKALMLSCRDCNDRKADRLPLSLALLLLATVNAGVDAVNAGVDITSVHPTSTPVHPTSTREHRDADWLSLASLRAMARLASARLCTDPADERSTPDQHAFALSGPIGLPDSCLWEVAA